MPNTNASSYPLLLVDKEGHIGELLLQKILESHLTVFVSAKELPAHTNLIQVPFKKRIPKIPDNVFSQIVICYQGEKELREALPSFIAKAKESGIKLTFITDIFHYRDQLSQRLFRQYANTQVLVIGDMFGKVFSPTTPVNRVLFEAKTTGKVSLMNNGLSFLYPVYEEDVAEGMQAVLFSFNRMQETYLLFPQHPVTVLSFVRSLEKTYPLLGIDFRKGKPVDPDITIPQGMSVFGAKYPLEHRLKAVDLTHTPLFKPSVKKIKKQKRIKQKRPIFLLLSLFFFLLSLPILSSVGLAMGGGALLLNAQHSLSKGDIHQAKQSAQAASSLLSVADQSAITLRGIVSLVGLQGEILGFQSTIHTGKTISTALVQGLDGMLVLKDVMGGKESPTESEFVRGLGMIKESARALQKLQVEGDVPAPYKEKLALLEEPFVLFLNTADAYPVLFGFDAPKTYLVLFQNNYELRPTGGFIGSYGIVKVEKGRIIDFTVEDVYDADGKLTAAIEPPYPLQRYMGASNWFLRDSNYAIDFPTSAANAASFLEMETGQKVNGVFAVDVYFIASLLHATGPIKIPDYNETLTPENFFITTQKHVEEKFFPGSTQKKDYLRTVKTALETRFTSGKLDYQKLVPTLLEGIKGKHILVAFSDQSLQRLFTVNKLSGALTDLRPKSSGVFLDTVGVNEANIGLNKGNYYLTREIEHNVSIDGEGRVGGEVAVTYHNTSKPSDVFGGEYKAYVRVVVPAGALLREVRVNGEVQATPQAVTKPQQFKARNFKAPEGMEIERVTQDSYTLFGFYVNVPMQQKKEVVIAYDLPSRVSVDNATFSYDLTVIKQPGTEKDPYKLAVTYPVATRLLQSSLPVSDVGGKLVYETTLTEDKSITLQFGQR